MSGCEVVAVDCGAFTLKITRYNLAAVHDREAFAFPPATNVSRSFIARQRSSVAPGATFAREILTGFPELTYYSPFLRSIPSDFKSLSVILRAAAAAAPTVLPRVRPASAHAPLPKVLTRAGRVAVLSAPPFAPHAVVLNTLISAFTDLEADAAAVLPAPTLALIDAVSLLSPSLGVGEKDSLGLSFPSHPTASPSTTPPTTSASANVTASAQSQLPQQSSSPATSVAIDSARLGAGGAPPPPRPAGHKFAVPRDAVTGVVVDIGHTYTTASVVVAGVLLRSSTRRSMFAGRAVANYLGTMCVVNTRSQCTLDPVALPRVTSLSCVCAEAVGGWGPSWRVGGQKVPDRKGNSGGEGGPNGSADGGGCGSAGGGACDGGDAANGLVGGAEAAGMSALSGALRPLAWWGDGASLQSAAASALSNDFHDASSAPFPTDPLEIREGLTRGTPKRSVCKIGTYTVVAVAQCENPAVETGGQEGGVEGAAEPLYSDPRGEVWKLAPLTGLCGGVNSCVPDSESSSSSSESDSGSGSGGGSGSDDGGGGGTERGAARAAGGSGGSGTADVKVRVKLERVHDGDAEMAAGGRGSAVSSATVGDNRPSLPPRRREDPRYDASRPVDDAFIIPPLARVRAPELLFSPSDVRGASAAGVHALVLESIESAAQQLGLEFPVAAALFLPRVVVVGGCASIPGLAQRLANELQCAAPKGIAARVVRPLHPHLSVMRGAARACESEFFASLLVPRSAWEQNSTATSLAPLWKLFGNA